MDIVFFGSGAFGVPTLAQIASTHILRAVITQPDRPAGRGGVLTPTPIATWAAENAPQVPVHKPEKVNVADVVEQVRSYPADAWVVIAFGQKLGKSLLDGKFAINLHASLLPRWRGAAPINAAILGGDTVTGNSVITLADKMDAGLVLGQSTRDIAAELTAGGLHDLLAADGSALVLDVLTGRQGGTLTPKSQNESLVTLAGKFSKTDGYVDFSRPAEECRRRVHGLTPWPGVTVQFRGAPLKLLRVMSRTVVPTVSDGLVCGAVPGEIVNANEGVVACGDKTALTLLEVQPANGKPMTWAEFARGRQPKAGELLVGSVGGRGGAA